MPRGWRQKHQSNVCWKSSKIIGTWSHRLERKNRYQQTWISQYKICKPKVTSGFCAPKSSCYQRLYHRNQVKNGKVITIVEFRVQKLKVDFKMWNSFTKWETRNAIAPFWLITIRKKWNNDEYHRNNYIYVFWLYLCAKVIIV